jgi:N6-L-threonylcarbamoyladenine synthase
MSGRGLILGIESSCDETAAAVVERGARTLSSVVASQIATHAKYGGVVPELASREHLRAIVPVVRAALAEAAVGLADIDAIAVTSGPGLAGALLVGITYAKALAFAQGLPLIAVNHLEGHIHAVLLEERQAKTAGESPEKQVLRSAQDDSEVEDLEAEPALALVVSGGHTHLYLARPEKGTWRYTLVGRTLDDAAGEASALDPHFLFSFSGIKTAVLRYVELHHLRPESEARREALFTGPDAPERPTIEEALATCDPTTLDLIASFQHAVVGDLMKKTFAAAEALDAERILVTGGVAANRELRERFTAEAARRGIGVAFPTLALSTDNAAMIAAAAWPRYLAGEFAAPELTADPSLVLGR